MRLEPGDERGGDRRGRAGQRAPGARAWRKGEIILAEVDRHAVTTADAASTVLQAPRKGGHLLRVRGGAGTRFVTIGTD